MQLHYFPGMVCFVLSIAKDTIVGVSLQIRHTVRFATRRENYF